MTPDNTVHSVTSWEGPKRERRLTVERTKSENTTTIGVGAILYVQELCSSQIELALTKNVSDEMQEQR
jgi:hypothetical protein